MSANKNKKSEIPVLKKREVDKERKGGAAGFGQGSGSGGGILARWFGIGARPAGTVLSKGAGHVAARASVGVGKSAMVGASMKLGLVPTAINFVSSNFGMAVVTAALTGGSVYALFSFGLGGTGSGGRNAALFPASQTRSAVGAEGSGGVGSDPGSLNFFTSANKGKAFNRDGVGTIEGEEKFEEPEEAVDASGDEAGEEEGRGSGPDLAEALTEQLEKPKMIASKSIGNSQPLGSGVGLAGGTGMAAGVNRKFSPRAEKKAQATALSPARKLIARNSTRSVSKFDGKGPLNQLKFSNQKSVKSLGRSSAEGASFEAAEAFTAAPASIGNEIGGAGVTQDGAGMSGGANPNTDDGGPLGAAGGPGEEAVDDVGKSEDKSPYTPMVMMAMALLLTASTIITIVGILAELGKIPALSALTGVAQALYMVAIGMAAASSAMGVMIMQEHGQQTQGMILTAGGAITAGLGAMAMSGMVQGSAANWMAIIGGIAGMAAAAGSMLAPQMGGGGGFGGK